jgi:hypothetical protein
MSTATTFSRRAAIAGIGATEFSKDSGRSELQLACEAVRAAIDDAGLAPSDVDGLTTFTMDTNPEIEVARNVGLGDLRFFSRIHYGGGAACGTILQAAMAVATGMAEVVVCLPGLQRTLGAALRVRVEAVGADRGGRGLRLVHGPRLHDPRRVGRHVRPALPARPRRPGRVRTRQCRRPQATPPPTRRRTSTAARSPWRTTRPPAGSWSRSGCWTAARRPTAARPSSSPPPNAPATCPTPRPHRGCRAGLGPRPGADDLLRPRRPVDAPGDGRGRPAALAQSDLAPADIQTAVIYDHFTPFVLTQLEEFGFCGRGEAGTSSQDGRHRTGRPAAHQHPRRPAGRGLPARHERRRRGRPPGPRHRGQPGPGRRARPGHRRHRRPDLRPGPGRGPVTVPQPTISRRTGRHHP